jgi:hypothetical protein
LRFLNERRLSRIGVDLLSSDVANRTPISISGLGVREAAYWYFFSQIGVGQAEAIAASLLFFIVVGICSLPGAPLFVFGRKRLR